MVRGPESALFGADAIGGRSSRRHAGTAARRGSRAPSRAAAQARSRLSAGTWGSRGRVTWGACGRADGPATATRGSPRRPARRVERRPAAERTRPDRPAGSRRRSTDLRADRAAHLARARLPGAVRLEPDRRLHRGGPPVAGRDRPASRSAAAGCSRCRVPGGRAACIGLGGRTSIGATTSTARTACRPAATRRADARGRRRPRLASSRRPVVGGGVAERAGDEHASSPATASQPVPIDRGAPRGLRRGCGCAPHAPLSLTAGLRAEQIRRERSRTEPRSLLAAAHRSARTSDTSVNPRVSGACSIAALRAASLSLDAAARGGRDRHPRRPTRSRLPSPTTRSCSPSGAAAWRRASDQALLGERLVAGRHGLRQPLRRPDRRGRPGRWRTPAATAPTTSRTRGREASRLRRPLRDALGPATRASATRSSTRRSSRSTAPAWRRRRSGRRSAAPAAAPPGLARRHVRARAARPRSAGVGARGRDARRRADLRHVRRPVRRTRATGRRRGRVVAASCARRRECFGRVRQPVRPRATRRRSGSPRSAAPSWSGSALLQAADVTFAYGAGQRPGLRGVSVDVAARRPRRHPRPERLGQDDAAAAAGGHAPAGLGPRHARRPRPVARCSRRELARRIAVVPQETRLAFDFTVLEMVLMGRYPAPRARSSSRAATTWRSRARRSAATGTLRPRRPPLRHAERRREAARGHRRRARAVGRRAAARRADRLARPRLPARDRRAAARA